MCSLDHETVRRVSATVDCELRTANSTLCHEGNMKKVGTILGARPQFIKASVISRALRASGAQSSSTNSASPRRARCHQAANSRRPCRGRIALIQLGDARGSEPHPHRSHLAVAVHADRGGRLKSDCRRCGASAHSAGRRRDVRCGAEAQCERRCNGWNTWPLPAPCRCLPARTVHRAENTDDPRVWQRSSLRSRTCHGTCLAIWGLAFKPNTDDAKHQACY